MKAIVIGGIAAGMSAASKLRRLQPDAEIAVYEKGSFLSYGACGLPYFVGGFNNDPALLIARTPQEFAAMNIRALIHHEVVHVNAEHRTVTVKDHDSDRIFEDTYDVLMIAVGCRSVAPKIPGVDLPSVFSLRTMEDGLLLEKVAALPDVRNVVIIGGGYIGVEMAEALIYLGKSVTLLEAGPRILSSFEPEFSELASQELEKNGVKLMVASPAQEIREEGSFRTVVLKESEIRCDLVLVAAGIVPNTEFLKDTDIHMARNGAIVVDREMRTSLPNIYSAGDCATVYHRIMEEDYFIPLGTNANKCGRIAGSNMAGRHEKYIGTLGTAAIKVCELEMARTGLSESDAQRLGLDYRTKFVTSYDHALYYPGASKLYIKMIYEARTRRLLGACIAGAHNAVLRIDVLAMAVHSGMSTDELGMVDFAYAPPFAGVWDAVHIAANAAK